MAVAIEFAKSERATVGLEWELMLADSATGELLPAAEEILNAINNRDEHERYTITGELLTNTVEVTSGVGKDVNQAITDLADAIAALRTETDARNIALLSAGSHPFAQWFNQSVSNKTRYNKLIQRTQWWGRNMMIWGIHVHIGIEDQRKVFPIINALSTYLPHLQTLASSSPFWAGEKTGYASNRALVFQQLPTAGLPWPLNDWTEFEQYLDDMIRTGVMDSVGEVRWDIRPAPKWGTIEVRACDGVSTLSELAAIAALTQALVEEMSRALDRGEKLDRLQPWFIRENKWRAARYGLDARIITDSSGTERLVSEHLQEVVDRLRPIAADLNAENELLGVNKIIEFGTSASRQLAVADASEGDLQKVVEHLIGEFRDGPSRA